VLCCVPYDKQLEINDWTHQNGVFFIAAETRGLFGYVPSFGTRHTSHVPVDPSSTTSVLSSCALILPENSP
jgi:ubiquitin-activating enzyme E1